MPPVLPIDLLDRLAPMHLTFDAAGRVTRVGRTLRRIAPAIEARPLAEVIEPVHPCFEPGTAQLLALAGRRLNLRIAAGCGPACAATSLRAVVHDIGAGAGLMVLGFGADLAAEVARHGLAAADFAELDPTIEVLMLLEMQALLVEQQARYAGRLADARARAERAAATDALTGLPNRRAMDLRLDTLPQGSVYGLMQLDLDRFKEVNDRLGHAAGDHVLTHVARILREELREGDVVARMGGDEFLVLLEGCDDLEFMRAIAERIIARIERPIPFGDAVCRVSASIGAGLSRAHAAATPARLLAEVDGALYASKRAGRARWTVATAPGLA
jgi:diguanylate cyclase (GGDEF)-like protein